MIAIFAWSIRIWSLPKWEDICIKIINFITSTTNTYMYNLFSSKIAFEHRFSHCLFTIQQINVTQYGLPHLYTWVRCWLIAIKPWPDTLVCKYPQQIASVCRLWVLGVARPDHLQIYVLEMSLKMCVHLVAIGRDLVVTFTQFVLYTIINIRAS